MENFSRRKMLASLGLALSLPQFLAACGKKQIEEGVLRVALAGGPDSLDPLRAEFAAAALLFRQYLLPIVGYGKDGKASNEFAIAENWISNGDFTKWTFTIKPNLRWSDNQPLDAANVVASLKKAADWRTNYPDAPELFIINGFKDAILKKGDAAAIGVKQIGTNLVEVSLASPDAAFPERMQEFYPVPLHVMEKYGAQWTNVDKIVVSGPFIPKIYNQTRIRFEKNPLGGWKSNMATAIEVEAVDDAATRIRMFQSGDVDLAQDPSLLRYGILSGKMGNKFKRTNAPRLVYLSFNTKRSQFSNPKVRYALSLAFNRNIVSHNIMRDAVAPATRFIRSEPAIAANREQAREIMSSLGFSPANPLRFELIVAKDERERAAIEIANQWKHIGVEAIIGTVESTAISARLNGFDFDCAIVRIDKGMKSDPLDLMASFASGGNAYSHQWKNKDFDRALEECQAIGEPKARLEALLNAEKYLLDEVPIMPIWYLSSAWLQSSRISGGYENVPPIIWPSLTMNYK